MLLCCIWGCFPAKANRRACEIDTGVKEGLQLLVSCTGASFALIKFPLEAAIPGWIRWGFCRSSVWDQGMFVLGVCSALCRPWYAEVVYVLLSLENWSICSGAVWFSYLLPWNRVQRSVCERWCQRSMATVNRKCTSDGESVWIMSYFKADWFSGQYQRFYFQLRPLEKMLLSRNLWFWTTSCLRRGL